MLTNEKLEKMDKCRHLLPDPGAEVVGELIEEIQRVKSAISRALKIAESGPKDKAIFELLKTV